MGRRIVVGLDGTEYAANAVRVACAATKVFGGTLVGVAVVDSPGIEASARGAGMGAYEYARSTREQRLSHAHEQAKAFHAQFESACRDAGVDFELAFHDAVPFQALVDECRFADAAVIGTRTHFHHETQSTPGDTLRRLLRIGVCPVLAIPKDADMPQRALAAFDGSIQAARALRAYVHFREAVSKERSITLLHVSEGSAEDKQVQLDDARKYLECHGYEVSVVHRSGKASQVIEDVAVELAPCGVITGAYGRRGIIQNLFFGSTAANLIKHERVPLFVYH